MLDFSSVLLLRQDETVRLGAPSSIAKGAAGAAPPLLESIPTASFCSILSSMSTQGQGGDTSSSVRVLQRKCSIQVQQQKRSIFSHYWMKTGQNPIELTPSTAEDSSESALTVVEAPQNFGHDRQEQFFPQQAENVASPASTIRGRGIMLGERASSYYSNPSFSTVTTPARAQTKKKKSGASQSSCLRTSSRFSGSRNSRSCTSNSACSSGVGFSDQVDVVIYQKPSETYSEEGWSRFFSI